MTRHLSWEDAQTFLAVAELGSFSAAARRLDVGQPTVSRRIKTLETRLQQPLFERGKYGARLTTTGVQLLPAAEQMAKWAVEFDHAARGFEVEPSGIVRIAAPPGVAVEQLAPFAGLLRARTPDIRLEVLSAVDHVDLTRGAADLAIRTQPPTERELIAVYEAASQPGVYASSEYAASLPVNASWQDIDWVTWTGQYRHVTPRPMLERLIEDFEPAFASDDYLVQKAAVKAGVGAMITGAPQANEKPDLTKIDLGIELPELPFYIVCARSMQHVPRIRLVIDALIRAFESGNCEI